MREPFDNTANQPLPAFRCKLISFIKQEYIYIIMVVFTLALVSAYYLNRPQPYSPAGNSAEHVAIEEGVPPQLSASEMIVGIFTTVFFIASLVMLIIYIIKRIKGKEFLPREAPNTITWNIWDVIKVASFTCLMIIIIYFLFSIIAGFFPSRQAFGSFWYGVFAPLIILIEISAFIFCLHIIKAKKGTLADLGIKFNGLSKNIKRGLVAYLIFFSVLIGISYLSMFIASLFKILPPDEKMMDDVIFYPGWGIWRVITGAFIVSVAGPIMEEIFFRGFFFGALRKRLNFTLSVGISSLVFALLHGQLAFFLPFFAIGILLCYLYERTQSLIPSITVHIIHNSLSSVIRLVHYFIC